MIVPALTEVEYVFLLEARWNPAAAIMGEDSALIRNLKREDLELPLSQ